MNDSQAPAGRRHFLQAGAALALQSGFPAILKGQVQPIKFGLVGCGGRGTGAASQALKADDYSQLHAVADVDQNNIDACLQRLKRVAEPKVLVPPERQFKGLNAFQQLIESGVDVVLLATPPGFRPQHVRAAIAAGKHVFCEKPVAIDSPGVRHVLETAKMAKEKNLSLVAGFCWRYTNYIGDPLKRVFDGAIGDIVSYYGTYYTSPVKPMPPENTRPAGMSDVEWQIRNWYNFVWLCGDGLVEQAIHTVDKVGWAFRDAAPVSCVAVGGRQIPATVAIFTITSKSTTSIPTARVPSSSSARSRVATTRTPITSSAPKASHHRPRPVPRIKGETNWTFEGQRNDMYQAEHDALFAAIRKGQPINDGDRMATSTLLGIMGRMAAYTGQQVTWEQAMNSKDKLVPDQIDWNGSLEVRPMAQPGQTKLL